MLKNKIIMRKIRNLVILLMAMVVMIGAYKNIRDSRAENVIEIALEVTDKGKVLETQTITAEATEVEDGIFLLDLPKSVNGNIVTKYYTAEGEEVLFELENHETTLQLTDEEVANQKVQLETEYDKKEVIVKEQSAILYNKELKYNEELIVTGYMPLNAQLENVEIDVNTLANVQIPEQDGEKIEKTYDILIFEEIEKEIEKQIELPTEPNDEDVIEETNTEVGIEEPSTETVIEKVEYDPSIYQEILQISIKYKKENEIVRIYGLNENNESEEISVTEEDDGVTFETEKIEKYILTTEKIEEPEEITEQESEEEKTENNETTKSEEEEPGAPNQVTGSNWEVVTSTTDTIQGVSTIVVKGPQDILTEDCVRIRINGEIVTQGITKEITKKEKLEDGIQYTIKVTGFTTDTYQMKIELAIPKTMVSKVQAHKLGNSNNSVQTQNLGISTLANENIMTAANDGIMLLATTYNTLKSTSSEKSADSGFLGNANIQRQNIESVTFQSSTSGAESNNWDVSEAKDGSIIAWYKGSGPYQVYIGSDSSIYANSNSNYLFAFIANSSSCKATSVINNLSLLNTSNATQMGYMFYETGLTAMTSLSLGSNFNTSNVTNMDSMFYETGFTAMTSLSLGSNFNTSNVTNMNSMFRGCGKMALTSLNLGTKFYTSNVTDMGYMFRMCGYTKMAELKLGSNFDTSNVTDMRNMFYETGYAKMTSLDLGSKFNTSKVTNMRYMFASTGHELMTTLSLGSKFDTSNVTDMEGMFLSTGNKKLQSLNLGSNFNTGNVTSMIKMFRHVGEQSLKSLYLGALFDTSKVTDMTEMFYGCGESSLEYLELGAKFKNIASTYTNFATDLGKDNTCVVFCVNDIYNDLHNFKQQSSNRTIAYDRGFINPTSDGRKESVKPVIAKVSATNNTSAKTQTIVFKATDAGFNAAASAVSASNITVLVNDTANTKIKKGEVTTKPITDGAEYSITLSELNGIAGTISIKIAAGVVKDYSGNTNNETTITGLAINYADSTKPTWDANVTSATYDGNTKAASIKLTGRDETELNTTSSKLTTSNVAITVDGTKVTPTIENKAEISSDKKSKAFYITIPNLTGENIIMTITAGALVDAQGNQSDAKTYTFTVDGTPPTCTITANPSANPTNASSITYTFTFNENVTGFEKGDITVKNGSGTTTFNGRGKTYTLVVPNSGSCTQKVSIADGVCTDAAGNNNKAASKEVTIDRTAPTVTVSPAYTTQTTSENVTITATDTGGSGLADDDNKYEYYLSKKETAIEGGTWDSYESGKSKTIGENLNGTYYLFVKTVKDNVGNTSSGNATIDEASYHKFGPYVFLNDQEPPECVITANPSEDPTNASSITYTFTFTEDVTGFDTNDISVAKGTGTKGAFKKIDNSTYTLVVTNSGSCSQTVSIAAGACTDEAGNDSKAASKTVTIDKTAPVISASPASATRCEYKEVTISITETGGSELADDDNKYEYYLTTNNTQATGGTWNPYQKGTKFKIGENLNGTYYLYVRKVKDKLGNESSSNGTIQNGHHRFGPYEFLNDKTAPAWNSDVSNKNYNSSAQTYSFEVTGKDEYLLDTSASGLAKSNVSITVGGTSTTDFTVTQKSSTTSQLVYTITINKFYGGEVKATLAAGTLKDLGGNTSAKRDYTITTDSTIPTWNDLSKEYSASDRKLYVTFVGTDNMGINTNSSKLTTSNVTVKIDGTTVNTANLSFEDVGLSTDRRQKTFKLTISNFPGGNVAISINAEALVDTSENKSAKKDFTSFYIDGTIPVWNDTITNHQYSASAKTFSVNLTGSDNVGLANTSKLSGKVTVKVNGTAVSSTDLSYGSITTSGTSKTFPLTIKNYTGGEISITVSSGALVDTSGNVSEQKTFTSFTPDTTPPEWNETEDEGTYSIDAKTYAFSVTGTDNKELANTSAITGKVTITVDGTQLTTTTSTTNKYYKIGTTQTTNSNKTKTFPITLYNFTGGNIKVTISEGALVDTTTNISATKIYNFYVDGTRPEWNSAFTEGTYNKNTGEYTFELIGSDNIGIDKNASEPLSEHLTITTSGQNVTSANLVVGEGVINDKTISYPVTIKNFLGGNVQISISAEALVDTSNNKSVSKTYSFFRDITPPVWANDVSEKTNNSSTKKYTFKLTVSDETQLSTTKSELEASDLIIKINNSEINTTNHATNPYYSIGTGVLSGDSKTKTYQITLNNFEGGDIEVTVLDGAVEDTSANTSNAKFYLFTADVTPPEFINPVGTYNPDEQSYTITVTGSDNEKLVNETSQLTILNTTVEVGGTEVTPTITTISTTSKTEDYQIKWFNHTGGTIEMKINAGALIDATGNANAETTFTFNPVDVIKPIWQSTNESILSGGIFDWDTRNYTIYLEGADNSELNDTASILDSSKITITTDGTVVNSSDLVWGATTLNGKVKTFPLTIKNFKGGNVTIKIIAGVLVDATGNKSLEKEYAFFKDVTRPIWTDDITNKAYNPDTKVFTFTLKATDETGLNNTGSAIDTSSVSIKIDDTEITDFTVGTGTISGDGKSKTFPLAINNYTGGAIEITINGGTLKDTAGNANIQKTYASFIPDIIAPVWSQRNETYDADNRTYSVELVGTDERAINSALCGLVTSGTSQNITVKCGDTTVEPSIIKSVISGTQVAFTVTINDYPGGEVTIDLGLGALLDAANNKSIPITLTLAEKDVTIPVWSSQNVYYSQTDRTYTFELVGSDNDALNSGLSNLVPSGGAKNISILCGTTPVTPIVNITSIQEKQIIYTVVIPDYPAGVVNVTVNAGALVDVTGNKSEAKPFTFPAEDIAKPEWSSTAQIDYNETSKLLSITLIGTDETSLNNTASTLELEDNINVYIAGNVANDKVTLGTPTIAANLMTKTFPLTIPDFEGGIVEISIGPSALVDNSGKESSAKSYSFTDVIKPKWETEERGVYDKTNNTYTLTFTVRDDTEIASSTFTTSNSTVKVANTTVTPEITLKSAGVREHVYEVKILNYFGGKITTTINAGAAVDGANNQSEPASFEITPDIAVPTWTAGNAQFVQNAQNTITVDLIGTDETLLKEDTLTLSNITVSLDGILLDRTKMALSTATVYDEKGGVKYVLTISEYYGGDISIAISKDTLKDDWDNMSVAQTLTVPGIIPPSDDDIPVVSNIVVEIDKIDQAVYITFDVTDTWLDYNDTIDASDFIINKICTRSGMGGTSTTQTADVTASATIEKLRETRISRGKQFKFKFTNIDLTRITSGYYTYTYSATQIYLKADAMKDRFNKGNEQTELMNQKIDYTIGDDDAGFKLYNVELNQATDEMYIDVSVITTTSTSGGSSGWPWFPSYGGSGSSSTDFTLTTDYIYKILIDGNNVPFVTSGDGLNVAVAQQGESTTSGTTKTTIYRITLSNFDVGRQGTDLYKEWSGNVAVQVGTAVDNVITLENDYITSNTEDKLFADFLHPEIDSLSSTINDEEADSVTLELRATDKYITPGTGFIADKAIILVDGVQATGTTITFSSIDPINATRNGAQVPVGFVQNVTITGISKYLGHSIKLRLDSGAVTDLSGNESAQRDIVLFNMLRSAATESGETSAFLGNASLQRENIESITFADGISGANSTKWDVSAEQDQSIWAWYTGTGPYQVYIGSEYPIYANGDSSYLFAYIGVAESCTASSVINNLDRLNTRFVVNMTGMFEGCGYAAMTSLNLGENFDTRNVTNMDSMFLFCGTEKMITLDLGNKFNTSKVINMDYTFAFCGYTAMTTINLGDKFDTSKVESMTHMFQECGKTKMTSLALGNKFYTSNVTDMECMFSRCGYDAMTTLDLGPAFTKIADTNSSFVNNCGKEGAITIYTGEAIYKNKNRFKLSTENGAGTIDYTRGTIKPKYKPEWIKNTATFSEVNQTVTIKLIGQVNSDNYGEAIKTITSTLANGELPINSISPINLKIDGEVANNIQKELSMVTRGPATTVGVTIILSNFAESTKQLTKQYMEWAGNIALQMAAGTLVDSYGNRNLEESDENGSLQPVEIKDSTNISQNTNGKLFADFIKPDIMYDYSNTIIDYGEKTVKIEFSVTDKYYNVENLDLSKLTILMDGTNLKQTPVQISLLEQDILQNGGISIIGRKYILTLTELQQDIIANGKSYLDYSGTVTIGIPAGEIEDQSGNINAATSITVGVDKPTNPEHPDHTTPVVVDVVSPTWTNSTNGASIDFESRTATINIKATDKYYKQSTLANTNVKLFLDGVETSTGVTINVGTPTEIKETRLVNGSYEETLIGEEYTITVSGISLDANQVKLKISADTAEDQSGNKSEECEIIIYNRLKKAEVIDGIYERRPTDGFLGNVAIKREDIQNITFVSGIAESKQGDVKQIWDVSASGDETILAWTKQSSAPYTVYIGGEGTILANRDSSYLFAHIGYGTSCIVTETITNIDLLNTYGVTDMQRMFWFTGYRTMTSLDLGENFETNSVENMREMFTGCGYTAMTTIDLGEKFDTTNVTDMSWMFANCGYTAMTSLNLGEDFYTSNVTDMGWMFTDCGNKAMTSLVLGDNFNTEAVRNMCSMFKNCGYEKLTELDLGNYFDTSLVADMSAMFEGCGNKEMTSLVLGGNFNTSTVVDMSFMFKNCGSSKLTSINLGEQFNTASVTRMNSMFENFGQSALTILDLGDLFDTSEVVDMTNMFNGCGQGNMRTLDLGPAFTFIPDANTYFAANCGVNGDVVIYAGEAIYSNENAFKLNTGLTTEISFERGTINPKYKPQWTNIDTTYDAENKTLTVTLQGKVNSTDYGNAVKTVTNLFTNGATTLVDVKVDGEDSTDLIKEISGANSTEGTTVTCSLTLSNFEEDLWQDGKSFKEWSGNIALQMLRGSLIDSYGNKNLPGVEISDEKKVEQNTNGKLFTDFIKPTITYEHDETIINREAKTVIVYFRVTDKYFDKTKTALRNDTTASLINIEIDEDEVNANINKTLQYVDDVEYSINGINKIVGERYRLEITGLDKGDGYTYSGPMTLSFEPGAIDESGNLIKGIVDKSGNLSEAKSITIGVDDPENHPEHDSEAIVDVVSPVWEVVEQTTEIVSGNSTTVIKLLGKDKYLDFTQSLLEESDIQLLIDGEPIDLNEFNITLNLSAREETADGIKHTLTITAAGGAGSAESDEEFLALREQYRNTNGDEGRLYREFNSGHIDIAIVKGTLVDESGNTNTADRIAQMDIVDTIKPDVVKWESSVNTSAKTATIIFDLVDKYFSTSYINPADTSNIHVLIDGVEAANVVKDITPVQEPLTAEIDGQIKTIGRRYILILSNFEMPGLESGHDYKGLSGNVTIKVDAEVVKDTADNKNIETTLTLGHVDVIKPSVVYRSSQVIKNTNEVQIKFDVTDKFYDSGSLAIGDLTIMIQDGANDANYIDLKTIPGVNINLEEADKGTIGKTYTLTISDLEQLEIQTGRKYLDYSGNVTISIPANKIYDTSENANVNETITMGIDKPEDSGNKDVIDIVRPSWKLQTQNINIDGDTGIAEITILGADKYFSESSLTESNIQLWIDDEQEVVNKTVYIDENGNETADETDIVVLKNVVTIESVTTEEEEWIINGTSSMTTIGKKYVIKISEFTTNGEYAKIKIPSGILIDQSGNTSDEFEFTLYSCLRATNTESSQTSTFLGHPSLQRQDIESVTFVSGLTGINSTKWDVSAAEDGSIMAWYTGTGPYQVYIGSEGAIFANPNSSYLFSYIGYLSRCTSENVINNLSALNTDKVTDMSYMFNNTGYEKMKTLDLGDNFITDKVTNMDHMFSGCGNKLMTSFDLGDNFDTKAVTNMSGMFQNFGAGSLQTLTLENKFDTQLVTNMSDMFNGCGQNAMTTLTLGDKFNTSDVQNMSGMFKDFAKSSTTMTILDLGDNFYTQQVTNMSDMFNGCGQTSMRILDLGPIFTKIATTNTGFVTNTGKSTAEEKCEIKAPESIYSSITEFSTSTTPISYTRGTINPIYRTVWQKVSTDIYEDLGTISIVIKAQINQNLYPSYTNGNLIQPEQITVLVDGDENANDTITKQIVEERQVLNETTGQLEVQYTIELKDFEESVRQSGKSFKEWSGDIELKIARGASADKYGNSNIVDSVTGTPSTAHTNTNTDGEIFVDFIKPEITYISSETTIDRGNKILTIIFHASDKYIDKTNSVLQLSDLSAVVGGSTLVELNNESAEAAKKNTLTSEETSDGIRYTLVIKNLQQAENDGFDYSGPVTLVIPSEKIFDKAGNYNANTTITVGVDDKDGNPGQDVSGDGILVDVVDPVWQVGNITKNGDTVTVTLRAKDKYFASSNLTLDDITVKVNDVESTEIIKDITTTPPTDITETVNGVEDVVVGKEYTLILSNIAPATAELEGFVPTNKDIDNLVVDANGKAYYRQENGGAITVEIAGGKIEDTSENVDNGIDFDLGSVDITKPEVHEVQKIQNPGTNTETIIFNVTDKNYDPSDLVTKDEIVLWIDNVQAQDLLNNATLETPKPIKAEVDGEIKVLGHQYKLIIEDIAETTKQAGKDYLEWSGTLKIEIAENAARDLMGNSINSATNTITDFVDFVKPVIEKKYSEKTDSNGDGIYDKELIQINTIDKYIDTTKVLTADKITVLIDGQNVNAIPKPETIEQQEANKDKIWIELFSDYKTEIKDSFNKTVGTDVVNGEYVIGYTYTLVLSNFEQSTKQVGKNFVEWSGTTDIIIAEDAISDTSSNKNAETTMACEFIDPIRPVVEKVSSEIGENTETIYFNVIDKYLDSTDFSIDANEIKVYVDGEEATAIAKPTTTEEQEANKDKIWMQLSRTEIKNTFNKTVDNVITNGEYVVGYTYTVLLSNFEQATRQTGKDFMEWSGTVSIEIVENAVKDTSGNALVVDADERTMKGNFVDFIKPELKYKYQDTDIDYRRKTYTMTFDIIDKYYVNGVLSIDDITSGDIEILMQNGQRDANGNPIIYNLKNEPVTKNLTATPITKNMYVTNSEGEVELVEEHVIGHRYVLKLSDLEKLERKTGLATADYSGIVTVSIAANKVTDRGPSGDGTNPNKNVQKTITSGVDIPGGTLPDDTVVVDVVDPIWEKVSSSAHVYNPADRTTSIATVTIKGTDTYLNTDDTDDSTLTADEIQVYVNGEIDETIVPEISTETKLEELRTETVQYGVQYTITLNGWAQDASQVKLKILDSAIRDKSENGNKPTDIILYNTLRSTAEETEPTSVFLGEADETRVGDIENLTELDPIKRQDIEKIIFVNNISTSNSERVWDVSAEEDDSILAWTLNEEAPYTVYIGSKDQIFANPDSSYLFSNIGYSERCTVSTGLIENFELLNIDAVTNMEGMFNNFGYRTMTTLDLSNFKTGNVTNMSYMFAGCGYMEMTSLTLPTSFDTSNVTLMNSMFEECGLEKMKTLSLGNNFNTAEVTDMSNMFKNCGQKLLGSTNTEMNLGSEFITNKVINMSSMFEGFGQENMKVLILGTNFNTVKVENMNSMFKNCGYKLTTIDLGEQFNTSEVSDMESMFEGFGKTEMTTLDLGNLFYTTEVENMNNMFNGCGSVKMTLLDMGPAFTNIATEHTDFMTNCGSQTLVIYAPEAIYSNQNSFK